MKRSFVLAIAVAVAATLPSAAVAAVSSPDVPGDIAVAGNEKPFLAAHAVGVQIYACRSGAWALVAPRATLYGDNGQVVASHFGGPTWQARDGSSVVGRRVNGVTVDAGAIQWLLLSRASSSVGSDGDRLAGTTHIQRINTVGGLAPAATECVTEGTQVEVPYEADYVFWKAAE
jgi:hypothetical protein